MAGDGNNVIVGARTSTSRGAIGGVFLFDGTSGAQITSIANPDAATTTGFGSAVASVGSQHPDRVARRQHGRARGRGVPLRTATLGRNAIADEFVQPDGGGGNFGTSVAGTQNTALIGAPGAYLGTSDAGAAYLFDADPASPTFGNAISAVQEPTPTSGDAFGTAVGFDTGSLDRGRGRGHRLRDHRGRGRRSLSARCLDRALVRHHLRRARA